MISPSKEAALRQRKAELEQQLATLGSAVDSSDLQKISTEYHEVAGLLQVFDALTAAKQERAELSELLNDPDMATTAEQEAASLDVRIASLTAELEDLLHPEDPLDKKNIIVEIRPAAGGDESALFAGEMFRMYSRYAEQQNWKVKILSQSQTGIGGVKEITFMIEGNKVYRAMKFESGVHRVQRVPETEKSGRVHTSTITVAVMPEADEVDVVIDPKDLDIKASTSTGAGGQSVNTTYSAVRIVHLPTGIEVRCQDERNFQQNKLRAMQVLRARLLDAEIQKRQQAESAERLSQIGTGDRSEKIRTYNFPQDRITDHRINENFSNIANIMEGNLDPIINALRTASREQANATK